MAGVVSPSSSLQTSGQRRSSTLRDVRVQSPCGAEEGPPRTSSSFPAATQTFVEGNWPSRRGTWCQRVTEVQHRRNRSEEHTSELQSLMRISYAVFCLKKKKTKKQK